MDTKLFGRNQPGGLFSVVDRADFPEAAILWVGSGVTGAEDGTGFGRNPDAPFATLVYALTQAAAGDTIMVLPAHTETLSSASGAAILTLALAGLRVIGLGGRTRKPAFLIDGHANNYVTITGADTLLENCRFKSGHADVAKGFNVAAAGVTFRGCNFAENTAAENFLVTIQTTAAGDDLLIEDNHFYGVTQATEGIELVGACNRVTIRNNFISGLFSVSAISAITNACLAQEIDNKRIYNATTAGDDLAGAIDLVAASTGMVTNNLVYLGDDTDCLTAIDAANCGRSGNYAANEFAEEAGVAAALAT